MKAFWLVMMLGGLLLTAWLVLRDVQEQATGGHGAPVVAPVDRAAAARRTMENADRAKEQRIDDVLRDK